MTRSLALGVLFLSAILIAVAYVVAIIVDPVPTWAAWALMIGTSTIMLATTVLGASRGTAGVGKLALPFAMMFLVLLVGFGAVLVLPPDAPNAALWFGLPRRAAIVLYGIGILPLFVLPFAYALTFDSLTLSEEDLARVRAAKVKR